MDIIEKYAQLLSDANDFSKFVSEKKLTPAEMKKREEVAQAIERENPDMPMDKKMAIATATAKKVAEEAELDEASNEKPPFDPPYKEKQPENVKDKSGATHTPMSRARDLARRVIQKNQKTK